MEDIDGLEVLNFGSNVHYPWSFVDMHVGWRDEAWAKNGDIEAEFGRCVTLLAWPNLL